jgi:SAM-dependent methyltransferase
MSASDKTFAGGIPDLYERLTVPLLFEGYARETADRVAALKPSDVLEVAAGTGAVTRAMARLLGASARIVATDLNQPMLDVASRKQAEDDWLIWQQADALALPFEPRAFDVVVCQFGAMFFPDKIKGFREACRVLKPGGHYLLTIWDKLTASDFPVVVEETLAELFPDDPPRFMSRTPHGYWETERIRADLAAGGFRAIAFETLEQRSRAASARDVAVSFCQGTPLRNEIEARNPAGLDAVTRKVEEALAQRFGDDAVEGRTRAHMVTAVR